MKLVATTPEPRDPESGPKLPSELASVPDKEIVALYLAGHELAEATARSHDEAQEVVHTAYDQLLGTHRWDSAKEPSLRKHFLGLVKNELIQVRKRRNEAKRAKAERGFQRELSPYTSSAEAILLEREERQEREDRADRRREKAKRMVAELHRRVARHPAAAKVLEAWGDGAAKPEELAAKVGMTTGEVYEAKKVIKYHAEAIRDEEGDVDE